MGNCFTSSCLPPCRHCGALCNLNMFSNSRGDFTFLMEKNASTGEHKKRSFLSRLFERRKGRQKKQSTGMVDGLLNLEPSYHKLPESQRVSPSSSYINRDIQLQCLDARALLGRTNTPTPENSLDLEWEHETLPVSTIYEPSGSSWATSNFPEDITTQPIQSPLRNGYGMNTTDSDCSRLSSSANSLEWDNVQNSIHSEGDTIDTDTQLLLNEIDRLTMQALKETGVLTEDVSYLDDTL